MTNFDDKQLQGNFRMVKLDKFAGSGVQADDETVSVAFTTTDGSGVDFTMTKE